MILSKEPALSSQPWKDRIGSFLLILEGTVFEILVSVSLGQCFPAMWPQGTGIFSSF